MLYKLDHSFDDRPITVRLNVISELHIMNLANSPLFLNAPGGGMLGREYCSSSSIVVVMMITTIRIKHPLKYRSA